MGLLLTYIGAALVVSFLCSILEAVLLSLTPSYIATLENRGNAAGAKLRALKEDIDRPLAAILTLNTIANTVGASGAGAQALHLFGEGSVAIVSAALTFAILVGSEIIPKTLGAVYWKPLGPLVARVLPPMIALTTPFVWLARGISSMISKGKTGPVLNREEFSALADSLVKAGLFDTKESNVLTNLLRFGSLRAIDIMTPRTVVFAFPEGTTVGEALEDESKLRFSRIPIYRDTLDNITGFVLKHDMLLELARGSRDTPLETLKRPMRVVPEMTRVTDLFDQMIRKGEHLVLLAGEYGETSGVVTMEDIVETLLGMEIVDEIDEVQDMQALARKKWQERAERMGVVVNESSPEKGDVPGED
ncbi:MAG: HlyC/CorC family transporter [Chrysiogenetes bacterium]|nr:HlyC/CorC family transporter [Chrysiogenetes bacterium]